MDEPVVPPAGRPRPGTLRLLPGRAAARLRERLRGRPGGDAAPEDPPARPDARDGRPVAIFVGTLDGRHLWVAVDRGRESDDGAGIGLRLPDGTVLPVHTERDEATPLSPAVLAATVDLRALAAEEPLARLVHDPTVLVPVLVPAAGPPVPLWAPRGSVAGHTRRRASLPLGVGAGLRRAGDGTLEVLLDRAERVAHAIGFRRAADHAAVLVHTDVAGAEARVVVSGGTVLADLRTRAIPGGFELRLEADEVEMAPGVVAGVRTGPEGADVPLTRPDDDLVKPGTCTVLPALPLPGGGAALRLTWDDDGRLCLIHEVYEVYDDSGDAVVRRPGGGAGGNVPGVSR